MMENSNSYRHHVRNGAAGIFYERKKLLTEVLRTANYIETRKLPNVVKFLMITRSMRRQLASIRRMDLHLDRVMKALVKKEGG